MKGTQRAKKRRQQQSFLLSNRTPPLEADCGAAPQSKIAANPGPLSLTFLYTPKSEQAEGAPEGAQRQRESGWCFMDTRLKGPWAALGLQSPAYLRVYGLVLLQAHRVPEGLAAHLARKWSRAAVGPAHVHLQTVRCGEHLGASGAREKAAEGGLGVWTLEGHGLGAQAQG